MILLLNYLPYLIIALGAYLCYRATIKHKGTDKVGKSILMWIILTILTVFALRAVSTAYIGKPVGERLATPTIGQLVNEEAEAPPMRDVLRKPALTADESKALHDESMNWRKHLEEAGERKAPANKTVELPLTPPQQ